jgi:hypothetical protein
MTDTQTRQVDIRDHLLKRTARTSLKQYAPSALSACWAVLGWLRAANGNPLHC